MGDVRDEAKTTSYWCPYHRSQKFETPGRCPVAFSSIDKCALELVLVEEEGEEPPDCSCAASEASMLGCRIHGPDVTEATLAAWEASQRQRTSLKTKLVPVLCKELEVGDCIIWGGFIKEIDALGRWETITTSDYIETSRIIRFRGERGPDHRVTKTGTCFMVPAVQEEI